jgi:hypothetical protein
MSVKTLLYAVCASTILVIAVEGWNFFHLYNGKTFFNIKQKYNDNSWEIVNKKPNIYHILFDGYQSDIFKMLADDPKFKKQLKGFTWHKDFITVYQFTRDVMPALFLGKIYDDGDSYRLWRFRESVELSFVERLRLEGYKINGYNSDSITRFSDIESVNSVLLGRILQVRVIKSFFETWLIEHFPKIYLVIKNRTDPSHILDGIAPFRVSQENESVAGVFLFKKNIKEEPTRGSYNNYNYFYLQLPHDPFVIDKNCRYSPKKFMPESESARAYMEQCMCANRLMAEFIHNLKRLNRFDESLIIIQSDHGWNFIRNDDSGGFSPVDTPSSGKDEIEATAKYLKARASALLLVKLPGDQRDFSVSDSSVSMLDVAPTIIDIAGGDTSAYPGISLGKRGKSEKLKRDKEFYFGNYTNSQIRPDSYSKFVYQQGKWHYSGEMSVNW